MTSTKKGGGSLSSSSRQQLSAQGPPSLTSLKEVFGVLLRNSVPTEENEDLIVECIRRIAEIIAWGDQNDHPEIFEFFMEGDILKFITALACHPSSKVHIQVFQSLGIWLETLRAPTSRWYLLSNNFVNDIISYGKIDLDHEDVLGYYVSLLKMLALQLNQDTILLFRNMQSEFPLYTQAVKLYSHENSMVRIAVRNITLYVYRVKEPTLEEWLETTAAPAYFTHLAWVIGNHCLKLDNLLKKEELGPASALVVEISDNFQYLDEILHVANEKIQEILRGILFNNLFASLLIHSLSPHAQQEDKQEYLDVPLSLFLLASALETITDKRLLNDIISTLVVGVPIFDEEEHSPLQPNSNQPAGPAERRQDADDARDDARPDDEGDSGEQSRDSSRTLSASTNGSNPATPQRRRLSSSASATTRHSLYRPEMSLDKALSAWSGFYPDPKTGRPVPSSSMRVHGQKPASVGTPSDISGSTSNEPVASEAVDIETAAPQETSNVGDYVGESATESGGFGEDGFLRVLNALSCHIGDGSSDEGCASDRNALSALCLLQGMLAHHGVAESLLAPHQLTPASETTTEASYNKALVGQLLQILSASTKVDSNVRLVTSTMAARLLHMLVVRPLQADEISSIRRSRTLSTDSATSTSSLARTGNSANGNSNGNGNGNGKHLSATPASVANSLQGSSSLAQSKHCSSVASLSSVTSSGQLRQFSVLTADHKALIQRLLSECSQQLKDFLTVEVMKGIKSGNAFVESFEAEQHRMKPLRLSHLLSNATVPLDAQRVPTSPSIQEEMRLPTSNKERKRKAIQLFLMMRRLCLDLNNETETLLPLESPPVPITIRQSIPLSLGDVIPCNVVMRQGGKDVKTRRFLLVDRWRLMLLDTDKRNLSNGIVKFVSDLKNIQCARDKKDARKVKISVMEKSKYAPINAIPEEVYSCLCIFDDTIRSLTASQYVETGKEELRQRKLTCLTKLLTRLSSAPPSDIA